MTGIVVFLAVGLVLGVLAERLLGPLRSSDAEPAVGRPRRSRRRVFAWVGLGLVVLLVAGTVGLYLWADSVFDRIEKVDVSSALSDSGSGTNYLLVGSDNAQAEEEQRLGVSGSRSDTIMILHVDGGSARMLSLNRDLWVRNAATGDEGRINGAYNAGPTNLIRTITDNYGIRIDRYIEIDFASFSGLVDSFGGIDIQFANPAFDLGSGLDVQQSGTVHLDGEQALAYVRSRHYTEVIEGRNVPEGGLPDVNRTRRQQEFLRAIMAKAGSRRNPFTLMSAASKMSDGLRVDDDMTMFQAGRFAWDMGKLDPVTVELPVVPTTKGTAQVLELGPGAEEVLAEFR